MHPRLVETVDGNLHGGLPQPLVQLGGDCTDQLKLTRMDVGSVPSFPLDGHGALPECRVAVRCGRCDLRLRQRPLVGAAGEYVEVEDVREAFNDWLPPPHQAWGRQTFGERFEGHEALRALGAVRGQHPRTRRAVFKGLALTWTRD